MGFHVSLGAQQDDDDDDQFADFASVRAQAAKPSVLLNLGLGLRV